MRPKFRAWLKEENKMIEPSDILSISFKLCEMTPNYLYGFEKEKYDFSDLKLMQTTGLCDKEGTEVFEGDILKSNKYITSVFYERGAYCVKFRRTPNTTVTMDVVSFIEKYKTKIIGNIYENPELLEVE